MAGPAKKTASSSRWASRNATKAATDKFEDQFAKDMGFDLRAKRKKVVVNTTGSLALDYALVVGGVPSGRIIESWGPEHSGKSLRVQDPVLTPSGWRTMGDLSIGDQVIGSDGAPTEVLGVYSQGVRPLMRVTFSDGSSTLCDEDHLWQVQSRKQVKMRSTNSYVWSTKELADKQLRLSDGSLNYRIPMVAPVQYAKHDLPLEPYLLGVLLANGSLKGNTKSTFTTNDLGVVGCVVHQNPDLLVKEHSNPGARRWYVSGFESGDNPVLHALRALDLAGKGSAEKFIPETYLRATVEERTWLLQGLLDCDASSGLNREDQETTHHKGNVRYFTRSAQLAAGVQELVQSLGGTASIRGYQAREDEAKTDYVVSIVLPTSISPFFAAEEKRRRHESRGHREPVRSIVSIEPEGEAEAVCIKVAAADSLYVIEQHIVTHNTTLAIIEAVQYQRIYPNKRVAWVDMEQTFDDDWAESLGLDLSKVWFYTPKTAEDVADAVKRFVASGMCSLVVLDSIGGMISRIEMEKEADEATVGKVPGIVTRMVKACSPMAFSNGTTVHVINQVRAKIGGYGPDEDTGGGWALKHVTTMKMQVRKSGGEGSTHSVARDGKQVPVGHKIAVRVQKNKMGPYGQVAELWLHNVPTDTYGPVGIDQVREVFDFAKRMSLMGSGAGGNYEVEGVKIKGGEPKVMEHLRQHPEVVETLRTKVLDTLKGQIVEDEPESEDPLGMSEMVS